MLGIDIERETAHLRRFLLEEPFIILINISFFLDPLVQPFRTGLKNHNFGF
jgi:hypothetical protein